VTVGPEVTIGPEATERSGGLSRPAMAVMSAACGVSVANVYFPQAVSPLIAARFQVAPSTGALVATAAQFGYAAGLFLLVPLGDRIRPRRLTVVLLGLTAAGLAVAGFAPSLAILVGATASVGVTTVVPQILLPLAAGLAAKGRQAAVTGSLLSGLLGGILLARTFSGGLGGWLGWRAPYLVAAGLAVLTAAALFLVIPDRTPPSSQSYRRLLATALRLVRTEPALARSCANQALLFGAFSAAWTTVALLLTGPSYRLSTGVVGLVALVGAGSVFATPVAGRRIDKSGPGPVNRACFLGAVAAAPVLCLALVRGPLGLAALTAGMLLLDVAVQCGQTANQARIFALPGDLRARRNTAYMTCSFLGGTAGSWLGLRAYSLLGWGGVPVLVAAAAVTAFALQLRAARTVLTGLLQGGQRHVRHVPSRSVTCSAAWAIRTRRARLGRWRTSLMS
jgi:predicted MFS family arabinose efflux permease